MDDNYIDTIDNRFYKPVDVNNATLYTSTESYWSQPNAIEALYAYEPYARPSRDELDLSKSLYSSENIDRKPVAKIPILVSEGLRGSLTLDTEDNRNAILLINGSKYEAEVVGMIAKMPGAHFSSYDSTKESLNNDLFSLGRQIVTSHSAMRRIIEEEAAKDHKVQE